MSPKCNTGQQAMIQDYSAVRGQSLSPRSGSANPYSTPMDRPQALSVDGPQSVSRLQPTIQTQGRQSNDPMSDI
eukprot:1841375-Amphidinium_carterae.1